MNFLIIGGTKFIGKAIAERAKKHGHTVTLFNRGQTDQDSPYNVIRGNVDQITDHKAELRKLNPDVVIHAIAYNERHGLDIVEIFQATSTRIVALGSQDCYEAFYQINHAGDIAEMPIGESSQTCLKRHYWQDRPGAKVYDDYDKNLMTDALLNAHAAGKIAASVLRIGMVFGPGDHQYRHRHGKFIRRIYDKESLLTLGTVEQAQLFTFGYIDNIAAAVVHAAENSSTAGKVFNIGESKSRSFRRWAELYGEAAGKPFEFSILPDAIIENDVTAIDNPPRLILMDARAFSEVTGFKEPVSLHEQIERTLAWGLKYPDVLGPKPDYELERRQRNAYKEFLEKLSK